MATDVSICSNALLRLGDQPINSLSEENDRARLASNTYPSVRDALLRGHPWNCAIKRVILSPDLTAPAYGWSQRFLLPGDFIRLLSVGEDGPADYELEDGYILMDESVCYLRYVYRVSEVKWDALLVEAATESMRRVFALPITTSASAEANAYNIVQAVLKQARAVDAQENPPETFGDEAMYRAGF